LHAFGDIIDIKFSRVRISEDFFGGIITRNDNETTVFVVEDVVIRILCGNTPTFRSM
jgi:hypothetical protein